jgi:hypothetical protein
MKRYWTLIALVPFIVVCIGMYYIQAAAASNPDFVLQKREGDEKAAAGVQLRGWYDIGARETVIVSQQGSAYSGKQSLVKQIFSSYWGNGDEIERLQKEHRQFMRGKRGFNSFYEDDNLLVYANVISDTTSIGEQYNFRFEVSVLDKKKRHSSAYSVSVPNESLYNWINVIDVQVVGQELKVAAEGMRKMDAADRSENLGFRSELHLYTLGLANDKPRSDQVIPVNLPETPGIELDLRGIEEINALQPKRNIVVEVVSMKASEEGVNSYGPQEIGRQLLAYDLQSGQEAMTKIDSQPVADLLKGPNDRSTIRTFTEGDNVFLTKQDEQAFRMVRYHLPTAKTTAHDIQVNNVFTSTAKNNLVYILTNGIENRQEPPTLMIADIDTGKNVYQGTIKIKEADNAGAGELRKLILDQISVK